MFAATVRGHSGFPACHEMSVAMIIARSRPAGWSLPVAIAMAFTSVTPLARGGQFLDVFVTSTGTGTQLVIGGFDDDAGTAEVPAGQLRVFKAEVAGAIGGGLPYETDEPGYPAFQALRQSRLDNPLEVSPANVYIELAPSTPLTFSFLPIAIGANSRNLFFWDGTGAVDFAPVGSGVVLSLTRTGAGSWTESIHGSSDSAIAGSAIATTSGVGQVHTHLLTSIGDNGGVPTQGFYLFSLQLEMAGYTPSESIYFVYGALDPANIQYGQSLSQFDAAHVLAGDWVQNNLVVVPEPSASALVGLAAVVLPWLCRSRCRRSS